MKPDDRIIIESPLFQGSDEQIAYKLTTTPWGSTPTSITAKIYLVETNVWTDYSTSCFGATTSTVSGDVITLPTVKSLTAGSKYRLEIKFSSGGNIFEPYVIIEAQR